MIHLLSIEMIIESIFELILDEKIEEKQADRLLNYYNGLQAKGQLHIEFYSELKL